MFEAEGMIHCQLQFNRIITSKNFITLKKDKTMPYDQHQQIYRLPIKSKAASITAAPLSIVAIRISCPGQSTKETCRTN